MRCLKKINDLVLALAKAPFQKMDGSGEYDVIV